MNCILKEKGKEKALLMVLLAEGAGDLYAAIFQRHHGSFMVRSAEWAPTILQKLLSTAH